ncbi:hypothetical protein FRB96_002477 [Tulasnella sp. 330]|nr:hypothetical protein FRB96_002477 [Tulasnella sp. 330]
MDDSDIYGDLYGADYDDGAETTEVEKSLTGAATGLEVASLKKDSPEPTPAKPAAATAQPPATNPPAAVAPVKAADQSTPSSAVPQLGTYQTNSTYSNVPAPTNPIASYSSRDDPPMQNNLGNHNHVGGYNNNAYQPKGVYQQRPDPSYGGNPGNGSTQQHAGASFQQGIGGKEADGSVRPSDMRDEGKMFVGGLNWETTTETLKEYFSQFGKVDACTIMRDGAGRSRGFAFLTFEDAAAVNAVMVREHFLDGKVIDPKRAIPRLEHQRTQKIFVGGLAPTVTAETLKEYFAQHGSVVDATVMIDRESGRSKGFGFVTFEEGPPLDHLIGHGITLDNKVIEVKLAQPRHAGRNRDEDGSGGGYRSGAVGGGGYNNNHGNSHNSGPQATAPPAFDAQAMANLYQRMMSVAQTGGFMGMGMGSMNPMMGGGGGGMGMGMGGMNPMMGGMGRGMVGAGGVGGMMGGAGGGMMAPGPGMGRGGPMMPGSGGGPGMGMGMGMGGAVGMGMGGGGGGPPRGPRAGVTGGPQQIPPGPSGPGAPGGAAGPMRSQGMRGQNTYHPYGRG